jgi:hypothetical protein
MASVSGDSLTATLFEKLQVNGSLGPAAAADEPATSDGQVQSSGPRSASRILLGVSFAWPAQKCSTPERTVKTRSRPTAADPRSVPVLRAPAEPRERRER